MEVCHVKKDNAILHSGDSDDESCKIAINKTPIKKPRKRAISFTDSLASGVDSLGFGDEYLSHRYETEDEDHPQLPTQDVGYSWVICCIVAISNVYGTGYLIGFGLIYSSLIDEFPEQSTTILGLIMGLLICSRGLCSPIAGAFSAKFGERVTIMLGGVLISLGLYFAFFSRSPFALIISLGCMVGIGQSFIDIPQISLIRSYFNKRLGTATSIRFVGTSIGGFIFPPLNAFLLENYGLYNTFLILFAILAQLCVMAALLRPHHIHEKIVMIDNKASAAVRKQFNSTHLKSAKQQRGKPLDYTLLCNPGFLLLAFINMARATAFPGAFLFIPLFGKDIGLSPYQNSILLSYYSITGAILKIFFGVVIDKQLIQLESLIIFGSFTGCCALVVMPFLSSMWQMLVAITLFAVCVANFIVTYNVLITEEFEESAPSAWAFSRLCYGVANLFTPSIAAYLVTATGNFIACFAFAASGYFASAIAMIMFRILKARRKRLMAI